MEHANILGQLTAVTNDLDQFVPLGVLFLYDRPSLVTYGLTAPDGWSWLELPYQGDVELFPGVWLSPLLNDLKYLNYRGHLRVTYLTLRSTVTILRVYVLPQDNEQSDLIEHFRTNFVGARRVATWHEKQYNKIMTNLIRTLDYSESAWNIKSDRDFVAHVRSHQVLLFSSMSRQKPAGFNKLGSSLIQESIHYHIKRLLNRDSYTKHQEHSVSNDPEARLISIYSGLNSPKVAYDRMEHDHRELINDILLGKIPGMKSELYNYQRRSVAKMLEKELVVKPVLAPDLLEFSRNGRTYYLSLKDFVFTNKPSLYSTPRGGILAEEMGLGKTCICLALICVSKYQVSEIPDRQLSFSRSRRVRSLLETCARFINQNSIEWKQYYNELPQTCVRKLEENLGSFEVSEFKIPNYTTRFNQLATMETTQLYLSSCSLIVVPDNLFHQWKIEIRKHVQDNYLKILEIHGQAELPKSVHEIVRYDILLVSLNYFSRQAEKQDSILRSVYWKRLIIDEGHSMNSKSTRAVLLAKQLAVERKWTITGTPTSGLTNLHVEEKEVEYTVKRKFSARDDLVKLGAVVSNFLKVRPWSDDSKLWLNTVIKPFEGNSVNGDHQLRRILQDLLVRHSEKDVEVDIKLPKLVHQPVFLKPSFFDKLSINLFIAVLATNAVTSERTDKDYMFHPSNKTVLRRLVNNLQKATFYWTGFSIQDIENLLSICNYAKESKNPNYSDNDIKLLDNSVYTAKVALSNSRWRTSCSVHEMSYFIANLPQMFHKSMSVANYEHQLDDFRNPVGVYGYPQLNSIQKLFYKNRLVSNEVDFQTKLDETSKQFWIRYWNSNDSREIRKKAPTRVSNQDSIDLESVKLINNEPKWKDDFDPAKEERKILSSSLKRSSRPAQEYLMRSPTKRIKFIPSGRSVSMTPDPIIPAGNFASNLRQAHILGTASVKLSYLTSRLLENQFLGIKSLVFYEFENSAYYLTELLDLLGMNYMMYSTYVKIAERSNNLTKFDLWDTSTKGGIALVMDVKLASHGLTIISATNVFFINPIWNKTMEAQAIKRSHRIGQTKEVHVETLILDNTIEKEMYQKRSQDKDEEGKELIDNSGMQEYIMRFEFLKLFEQFDQEYEPVRSKTTMKMDLGNEIDEFDDGVRLPGVQSSVLHKTRTWKLPLFTEQSLLRTTENESKLKDEMIDIFKTEFETSEEKTDSVKLFSKLKVRRRSVRFG
ncbi:hypothetical protein OGAPHI_000108 [Ogataea philodendri]|uniref:Helicase C-terminal domain-containing protein n=1 Tax=Ogataea philodendri TaxID=1378263 RepID=A0A9P8PII6_9ASCO|nr:uncharacterized protein OGAPHI_000108 [Ogataea philodendri]KAH3671922.1 hypothetical protein OGAPHI_000108 [Ogataea philodendri]